MFKGHLLLIILLLVILFSIGGVLVAVYLENPLHGGRGGAVAVTITLFFLVVNRNYATQMYQDLMDLSRTINKIDARAGISTEQTALKQHVLSLEARLNYDAQIQKRQNYYLAGSTTIGTFFWGFGDLFASWLM